MGRLEKVLFISFQKICRVLEEFKISDFPPNILVNCLPFPIPVPVPTGGPGGQDKLLLIANIFLKKIWVKVNLQWTERLDHVFGPVAPETWTRWGVGGRGGAG